MAIIAAIVRAVGLPACIIALLLVYYEGLPGASRIPFLTSIPVIGDLTTGRVHSFAADEVRRATKGLVDKAEIAALDARLARERALRHAADQAAEEARKRAMAAKTALSDARAKLEKRISEDTSDDGAVWTEGDVQWLEQ